MNEFLAGRIIPVGTPADAERAVPLAEALLAGGIGTFEIPLRSAQALPAIEAIATRVPDMVIGAGTVLTIRQLQQARDAGASFAVAPGSNPEVMTAARERGIPFIPGVATATEIEQALEAGERLLKFFPAEALGGVPMLQALAAPFAHTGVRFLPLGGIRPENAAAYLALDVVAAVGGSWLVPNDLVSAGHWEPITRLAREAAAIEKEAAA